MGAALLSQPGVTAMNQKSCAAAAWVDDGTKPVSSDGDEATFTIGDMAREFNLTLRALRLYEDKGLISPRHHRGIRIYRQGDRLRLSIILKAKKLGFTLVEIRQMLKAQSDSDAPSFRLSREECVAQINMLERQKREIEAALAELRLNYSQAYISSIVP